MRVHKMEMEEPDRKHPKLEPKLTVEFSQEELNQGNKLAQQLHKWAWCLGMLKNLNHVENYAELERLVAFRLTNDNDQLKDFFLSLQNFMLDPIVKDATDFKAKLFEMVVSSFNISYEKWEIFCIASYIQNKKWPSTAPWVEMMWKLYLIRLPATTSISRKYLAEMLEVNFPLGLVDKVHDIIHPTKTEPDAKWRLEEFIEAFKIPYRPIKNTISSLDHYQSFIREKIMKEFNAHPEKYHSLYFSVVQSSGYGKSRMPLEAGKRHLHTVYGCLRNSGSSGFPLSNLSLINFFESVQFESNVELFLAVTYKTALTYSLRDAHTNGILPLSLLEGKTDDRGIFTGFWDKVIATFNKMLKSPEDRKAIISEVKIHQEKYGEIAKNSNYEKSGDFYSDGNQKYPSELVVVFDDARFLFDNIFNISQDSLFQRLRSAHQQMGFRNMVLVFVDTISTISNFAPPYIHDPSARPHRQFDLLPVFYQIITYDSCLFDREIKDRIDELAKIFSEGRPLWNARFFSKSAVCKSDVESAIKYAMGKLSNSQNATLFNNFYGGLAVASILFGIRGVIDHSYATALLSSYMGTAMFFGKDRLRMAVHYVPEPILAEAAAQLLYVRPSNDAGISASLSFPGRYLTDILSNFEESIVSGLVDVGDIGELVCRMLLSFVSAKIHIDMANDKTLKDLVLFSDPIKLSSFLDLLVPQECQQFYHERFGVSCFDKDHESVKLLRESGEVAFTSFELLHSISDINLGQSYLKRAFDHRFAFVGRSNQAGCDLIIPVRYKIIGKNKIPQIRYSMIVMKIKNYSKQMDHTKRFEAAGAKLSPERWSCYKTICKDYIGVFIELNFERTHGWLEISSMRMAITLYLLIKFLFRFWVSRL